MVPGQIWRRLALALCVCGCIAAQPESHAQPAPPQIWFGPMQDHFDREAKSISWTYYDFPALLAPAAPWQRAAGRIDSMMFNTTHVTEGFNKDGIPSLPAIQAMLARGKFKAGGGGAVVYTDGKCQGAGVEGMTSETDFAHEVVFGARRWHDAGLPMTYFSMDGPFYFGYIYMRDKCHFTIEDVARRAATTVKMVKALYPDIVVIDAEGPGAGLPAAWLPDYVRFLKAFREVYGAPIGYLDMDLHWVDTWHTGYRWVTAAKEIADAVHRQGVRVALIVDADDSIWDPDVPAPNPAQPAKAAMTPEYWMAAVRKHIDLIKQNAIPLDAVDLESWMRFPRRNLPESDPLAWTSIIDYAHDQLTPSR